MVDLFMLRKFIFILFLFLTQNTISFAKQYDYEIVGFGLDFVHLSFGFNDKKFYASIDNVGLASFFSKSQTEIKTNFLPNEIAYFFKSTKKDKIKNYAFKKTNDELSFDKKILNKGSDHKNIKLEELTNVIDPLSAIKRHLFDIKNNFSCSNKVKIFDGDDVYQITLNEQKLDKSFLIKFRENQFNITHKCLLTYQAISGHKFKNEKKLNDRSLMVFFAKINNAYVPVYFETDSSILPLKMYLSTKLKT